MAAALLPDKEGWEERLWKIYESNVGGEGRTGEYAHFEKVKAFLRTLREEAYKEGKRETAQKYHYIGVATQIPKKRAHGKAMYEQGFTAGREAMKDEVVKIAESLMPKFLWENDINQHNRNLERYNVLGALLSRLKQ